MENCVQYFLVITIINYCAIQSKIKRNNSYTHPLDEENINLDTGPGRKVGRTELAFVAIVQRKEALTDICGASFVSFKSLTTSANCITRYNSEDGTVSIKQPRNYEIVAGSRYSIPIESGFSKRKISIWLPHPKYSRTNLTSIYDVGYIIVEIPFVHSQFIKTLELFFPDQSGMHNAMTTYIKSNKSCVSVGWGNSTNVYFKDVTLGMLGGTKSVTNRNILTKVDVKVVDHAYCRTRLCGDGPCHVLFFGKICTTPVSSKYGCMGESGFPLVCDGIVWGVAGVNRYCAKTGIQIYSDALMAREIVEMTVGASDPITHPLNSINIFHFCIMLLAFV